MARFLNIVGLSILSALAMGFMGLAFEHARRTPIDGLRLYNSTVALDVVRGSPADRAGIRAGDEIVYIDDEPIGSFEELFAASRTVVEDRAYTYTVVRHGQLRTFKLYIDEPPFPTGNFIGMLIGIVLVACAIAILLRVATAEGARVLLVSSLFMAMGFTVLGDWVRVASSPLLMKVFLFSIALQPGLILHFLTVFPERNEIARAVGKVVLFVHLPGLALFAVFFGNLSHYIIDGRVLSPKFVEGNLAAIWATVGIAVAMIGLGAANVVYTMRTTERPLVREQAKWVLLGLAAIPIFLAVGSLEVVGDVDNFLAGTFYPLSFLAAFVPMQISMVLALYRWGLDVIDRIILETGTYALSIVACAGLYSLLVQALEAVGEVYLGVAGEQRYTLAAYAAIAAFYPVRRLAAELAGRFIVQDPFELDSKMKSLAAMLGETFDRNELQHIALSGTLNAVRGDTGAVFSWDAEALAYRPTARRNVPEDLRVEANSPLVTLLRGRQYYGRGASDGRSEDTAERELRRIGAQVVLPIMIRTDLVGFVALGRRASGYIYTHRDIETLGGLARELGLRLDQSAIVARLQGELDRLGEQLSRRETALAETSARLRRLEGTASMELLEVFVLAADEIAGRRVADVLGAFFDVRIVEFGGAEIDGRPAALVVATDGVSADLSGGVRALRSRFAGVPVIGVNGSRAAEQRFDASLVDLALDGPEHVPEVVYRLHRMRHAIPLGANETLVYESAEMRGVVTAIQERVGPADGHLLLVGERGVGKRSLAKLAHLNSPEPRRSGPFVEVDLGEHAPEEMATALFGSDGKPGAISEARGGTLFVDRIDRLPYAVQSLLLEVLNVGELPIETGLADRAADVRLVCAAADAMDEARRAGRFREDLFLRISAEIFAIPPLRARPEDVKLLVSAFLDAYNRRHRASVRMPKRATMLLFERYRWPGNVAELARAVERGAVLAGSGEGLLFDLSADEGP